MGRTSIALCAAVALLLTAAAAGAAPRAVNGTIDLSSWRLAVDGPARLDGDWQFLPGVALEPDERWPRGAGLLEVPGSWTGEVIGERELPSAGVGTYRLHVRLPRTQLRELALRAGVVSSAYELSIDGAVVGGNGRVGTSRAETAARVFPRTMSFRPDGDSIEIRVVVANFDHRKGGIRRPVYLGTSTQLQQQARGRAAFDAVVAGLALLLGLYHLLVFWRRPRERANLAFGLFAVTMGSRGLLVGEALLPGLVWPGMPYSLRIAVEYVTMALGLPLLWWILHAMFPEEVPRSWVRVAAVIVAPVIALIAVTPPTVFTQTVLLIRLGILLSVPIALIALGRAVLREREGAGLILVGQLFLSGAVVYDIAFHSGYVRTDLELGTLGFVMLLASQALALAFRFGHSFDRIEALSAELSEAHAYNESILFSLRSGVLAFDDEGVVTKNNDAAGRILGRDPWGHRADELFADNAWALETIARVEETGAHANADDRKLVRSDDHLSVNLSVAPLTDQENQRQLGLLLLVDDVSRERRLKATMARYMSREVADRLIAGGEEALRGQLSEATVLFSDIRSFSSVSEGLGPTGTVQMLNEYFTIMVDEVFDHEGILDKYIGDAIMAVFGALGSDVGHAERAVRCAVGMMRMSAELNARRVERGEVAIRMGIGLNTDEIVHGNIGSPLRMDYTVIGDGVNLAARLESANVTYGTEILISEFTQRALADEEWDGLLHRELDLVAVKGKTQAVRVYEILEHRRDEPGLVEVIAAFDAALALYRARDWEAAEAAFAALAERDKPSRVYVARCAHFQVTPPPADWDGVWRMKTK